MKDNVWMPKKQVDVIIQQERMSKDNLAMLTLEIGIYKELLLSTSSMHVDIYDENVLNADKAFSIFFGRQHVKHPSDLRRNRAFFVHVWKRVEQDLQHQPKSEQFQAFLDEIKKAEIPSTGETELEEKVAEAFKLIIQIRLWRDPELEAMIDKGSECE